MPSLPYPLTQTWPLFEQDQWLKLEPLLGEGGVTCVASDPPGDVLAARGVGLWECNLNGNVLKWTEGVFDLFGLPRGATVAREETVALYAEPSRAAMERLRAYAIKHRRGFTLDAEIVPVVGARKWMRLIAAPICTDAGVTGLRGIKRDVSADYR